MSCSHLLPHTPLLRNPSPFFFGEFLKHLHIQWSSGMHLGLQFTLQIFNENQVKALWRPFSKIYFGLLEVVLHQEWHIFWVFLEDKLMTQIQFLSKSSHILISSWFLPLWQDFQTCWSIPAAWYSHLVSLWGWCFLGGNPLSSSSKYMQYLYGRRALALHNLIKGLASTTHNLCPGCP